MKVPQLQQSVQPETPIYYRKPAVAPEGAFGGGVAVAGMQASQTANQMAVQAKHKEDLNAVVDASNGMTSDMLNSFYGKDGLLTMEGNKADGISKQAEKFFNDNIEKYTGKMQNDDQVSAFKAHWKENTGKLMQTVFSHEKNEMAKYRDSQAAARQQNTIQMISQTANPELADSLLTSEMQRIEADGVTKGLSPEVITAKKNDVTTAAFRSAFETAITVEDTVKAKGLLEYFSGKGVDPQILSKAQHGLKKVQDFQTKQQTFAALGNVASSIVSRATRPDGTIDETARAKLISEETAKLSKGRLTFDSIVSAAAPDVGKKYALGGDGTATTDCGKFILDTFNRTGVNLGVRTVDDMYQNAEQGKNNLTAIDGKQLQPGDIIFYKNTSSQADEAYKRITHAGIYAGDGKILHAGVKSGVSYAPVEIGEIAGYARATGGSSVPDYASAHQLETLVNAKASEQNRIRTDMEHQYKKGFYSDIAQTDNLPDIITRVKKVDPTIISPLEQEKIIENYTKYFDKMSGPMTDEERMWTKYGKEGSLTDMMAIQTFSLKLLNPKTELSDLKDTDSALYKESVDIGTKKMKLAALKEFMGRNKSVEQNDPNNTTVENVVEAMSAIGEASTRKKLIAKFGEEKANAWIERAKTYRPNR